MADYIEREKIIELIDYHQEEYCEAESYFGLLKEDFLQLPSADVQPVKWISVTERWPEQFKPVLVYYNRNGCSGMGVAEYYHDGDTKVWRGCVFIPTHWMPLPEPPKMVTTRAVSMATNWLKETPTVIPADNQGGDAK